MSRYILAILAVAFTSIAVDAQGQHSSWSPGSERGAVDVEAGFGFAIGSGENPSPSLNTLNAGIVVWPARNWGASIRFVRGPRDRQLSPERLSYRTITARFRREGPLGLIAEMGTGLVIRGRFEKASSQFFEQGRPVHPRATFGGVVVETLLGSRFSEHFGFKAGVSCTVGANAIVMHPALVATVGF
jgi:hypothetical protein